MLILIEIFRLLAPSGRRDAPYYRVGYMSSITVVEKIARR